MTKLRDAKMCLTMSQLGRGKKSLTLFRQDTDFYKFVITTMLVVSFNEA